MKKFLIVLMIAVLSAFAAAAPVGACGPETSGTGGGICTAPPGGQ